MKLFEIRKWGPPALQDIFESIQNAINDRCPVDGLGTQVDYCENGAQINVKEPENKPDDLLGGGGPGGASSGSINIYGAHNGVPAQFHLVQTSAPTPLP